jgi:elongation factor P
MIPATQIKVGMVILHKGEPLRVTGVLHVTPGNWRGMVHAKMVILVTGSQAEHRFRSEDKVDRAELDHHPLQYLYRSGDEFTFMNTENYEMTNVRRSPGPAVNPSSRPTVGCRTSTEAGGVDLPMFVELRHRTDPVMKGATVPRPQDREMKHGARHQSAAALSIGDRVKIDTRWGFVGRCSIRIVARRSVHVRRSFSPRSCFRSLPSGLG